jgi:hypothetical protein
VSPRELALDGALILAAVNGAAGLAGALLWYRGRTSRGIWFAVRAGQAASIAYAALVGVLYLAHDRPTNSLFYLYALLPVAIGFVAEQLRVIAADQVLSTRGIETSQEVGKLPGAEQHEIVIAILRREMGVMAAAAIVVCFLALRAWGTY